MIWRSLIDDFATLAPSLWLTLVITMEAFTLAVVGGVALAVLFSQSRLLELALFPYAVILQVTPVVAIAPLVIIWVGLDQVDEALLILAWLVAFFPILSNTTHRLAVGRPQPAQPVRTLRCFTLAGADPASASQRLALSAERHEDFRRAGADRRCRSGVRGRQRAVPPGSRGASWSPANRLNIPRMFAALLLLSILGTHHIHGADDAAAPAAAPLARECDASGKLSVSMSFLLPLPEPVA